MTQKKKRECSCKECPFPTVPEIAELLSHRKMTKVRAEAYLAGFKDGSAFGTLRQYLGMKIEREEWQKRLDRAEAALDKVSPREGVGEDKGVLVSAGGFEKVRP